MTHALLERIVAARAYRDTTRRYVRRQAKERIALALAESDKALAVQVYAALDAGLPVRQVQTAAGLRNHDRWKRFLNDNKKED